MPEEEDQNPQFNALEITVYLADAYGEEVAYRAIVELPQTSSQWGMVLITLGKDLHRVIMEGKLFTPKDFPILLEMFPCVREDDETEQVRPACGTIRTDVVRFIRLNDGEV